jgi:N-acetylneuraminate synthase
MEMNKAEPKQTYIIAEAGVNHNGSLELARQLVDCAAQAGADAVKFQTFDAQKLQRPSSSSSKFKANSEA